MSSPRPIVHEYMQASEALLKMEDLTEAEIEAVETMLGRLSERLNLGRDDKT